MDETRRLKEKLGEIAQYVNEIEKRLPGSLKEYLEADLTLKRTFERDLQLISEIQLEILSLLIRAKGIGIAASENGLIDKFRNILSPKTIEEIRELRKLRNMLIHTYSNVKYDENVYISARELKKVKRFMREVEDTIRKK
ncbi:MAG: DUF86 domain-containing protein [Thermoplasmatales archaeon]|jgi:uncharacterized protein YutE (UPF0331/DUF86 family)|nr:DUF86 domain-containing protein [Candidatus Thermoplasmatota archaeon]MDA8054964.1 DUF86 domain-containing protein [Thermoplasmatales archaeon]